MRLLRLVVLASLLALGAGACDKNDGAPPATRWVELTRGFRPLPFEELAARLEARVEPPRAGRVARQEAGDGAGELWLELPLARESWTPGPEPQQWRAPLPAGGAMLVCDRSSIVLEWEDKVSTKAMRKQLSGERMADRFLIEGQELVVYLEPAEVPPHLLRARIDNGRAVGGHWRATQRDFACNGLLVVPGQAETIACEIPPGSRLCFATVAPDPDGRVAELGPTTFRVRLDGRALFEHAQEYRRPLRTEWHSLALDADGAHRLEFEVDGPAPALFAAPILAPTEIGRPGARPWEEGRPDIVLVICDTFRADNLAAWGGDPSVAPALNTLVERSLHFVDARATAAWTLPSIGTLMTGLFPGQHGGTDTNRGIAEDLDTLAKVLARSGYRTAAITDAALFSHQFGQDQGFEWFEETPLASWNLEHTLAKASQRMAADDGRPLFLVVHTYRVHGPMRVGLEEDPKPWEEAAAALARARANGQDRASAQAAFMETSRRFYNDAVNDLDKKLGAWIEELTRAGFFERGVLALTSDHGNAHGEHDEIGHQGTLYDVKLRVPLAFVGQGIAPRAVPGVVSLIDVAPTIAALAHVEPPPAWPGRSLLGDLAPRPSYAFDLKQHHRQVALFAEGRKVMAPDVAALHAGKPSHAFDLARDPGEEENQAASMTWPAELGRALADQLEPLLVPPSGAQTLELSPEAQQTLNAIGYGE